MHMQAFRLRIFTVIVLPYCVTQRKDVFLRMLVFKPSKLWSCGRLSSGILRSVGGRSMPIISRRCSGLTSRANGPIGPNPRCEKKISYLVYFVWFVVFLILINHFFTITSVLRIKGYAKFSLYWGFSSGSLLTFWRRNYFFNFSTFCI